MLTDAVSATSHPKDVKMILRLEGLAALVIAVVAYGALGGNWWLFALLILAPDLSFAGFAAGQKVGVYCYNSVHNYALPLAIGLLAYLFGQMAILPFVAIWVAHIGADRLLGYGLKYADAPQQTHLGRIGKQK